MTIAARRHALVRELDRQLAACGVRNHGQHAANTAVPVVIAVSGGPDSVALLLGCVALGLRQRRASAPLAITVAHVHHHLRDSADEDAAFVQSLCERLRVPCVVKHVHPRGRKGNTSAAARTLRYRALAEVASECGARWVLTAHHADDQLETMLMALCRGAGPRGLGGMRPVTTLEGVQVARPLLTLTKAQCIDFCAAAQVGWREDPSNADVSRRRARLRRDVMPVLEELWPGAAQRAARNSRLLHDEGHR